MLTLEQFIKTHGTAAMRIARADDIFNECLVLPFQQYLKDYNGVWGTAEGYILMRLRYAVLKFRYSETRWTQRHGAPLFEPVQREDAATDVSELQAAFERLDPEIQQVVELWTHGHSQSSISRELHIDLRKVRARLNAGITQLRKELVDALRDQVQ